MEKLDLSKYGLPSEQQFDPVEFGKLKTDTYNAAEGDLTGMDCKVCLNRGKIAHHDNAGNIGFSDCECMKVRRFIWKMEASGLKNIIKEKAMAYAEDMNGWLLFCGQVGSGKTHLCTAVCRHRLLRGEEVRYMPWRDEIARIKALALDNEEREKLMADLKNAQVLYIDDLFKTGKAMDGSSNPTGADIGIAFEIINYRYINRLPTIVSTEKTPDELLTIDEATASRIIEMSKANVLHIARQEKRNYRLRNVTEI